MDMALDRRPRAEPRRPVEIYLKDNGPFLGTITGAQSRVLRQIRRIKNRKFGTHAENQKFANCLEADSMLDVELLPGFQPATQWIERTPPMPGMPFGWRDQDDGYWRHRAMQMGILPDSKNRVQPGGWTTAHVGMQVLRSEAVVTISTT